MAYLVGSEQGSAPVHVILRLEHIHHLVGVELEHALHIHAIGCLGRLLCRILGLPLLHLLATLAFTNPPQVPYGEGLQTLKKKNSQRMSSLALRKYP